PSTRISTLSLLDALPISQNVMGYGLILVLLWFIQWLILHFAVKRQFKMIHQLSKEISEKNAHDLAPIQQQAPELKELQPMVWQRSEEHTSELQSRENLVC